MKGKRIISFLLALVMVLGMVPFNALDVFAAEVTDPADATAVGDTLAVKGDNATPAASNVEGTKWDGPVKSADVTCGKMEHSHTDDCYDKVLSCGHSHTADCYTDEVTCTGYVRNGLNFSKCTSHTYHWTEGSGLSTKADGANTLSCSHSHIAYGQSGSCYTKGDLGEGCPTRDGNFISGYTYYEHSHSEPGCYTYTWTLVWNSYTLNTSITGKDGVTIENVVLVDDVVADEKLTHGESVTLTISNPGEIGWVATVYDGETQKGSKALTNGASTEITVSGFTSGNINVKLTRETVYTVTLTNTTPEYGTASVDLTEALNGNTVTVTATPKANTDSERYALVSIVVNGKEIDGNTFTIDGANAAVEVTFSKTSLVKQDSVGTVEFNPGKTVGNQLAALKEAIFNAVVASGASIPEGISADDVEISYYPYHDAGIGEDGFNAGMVALGDFAPVDDDNLNPHTYYDFGERFSAGGDATEMVRITGKEGTSWAGLYVEAEITLEHKVHEYTSVVIAPTCTTGGYTTYTCACGDSYVADQVAALGHTPGDKADCENAQTCTVCGDELVPALGHTEGAVVKENVVAPDCDTAGSHDEVVYCSVCGDEISRTEVVDPALGHTKGEMKIENNTDASCTNPGSYDEVVRCTVCNEIITSNHVEVPQGQHAYTTEKEYVAATCTKDGYVIMACACGAEQKTTLTHSGHTEAEAVKENVKDSSCSAEGSYDSVVYCSVCGDELSREGKTIDKKPHTPVVDLAVAATCTTTGLTQGSHCDVCNEPIVAQEETPVLGHNWSYTNDGDDGHTKTCLNNATHVEAEDHTFDNYVCVCGELDAHNLTITLNGYDETTMQVSREAFKAAILEKAGLPANGDYKVEVQVRDEFLDIDAYTDILGEKVYFNYGLIQGAITVPESGRQIKITDNATGASKTVSLTVEESREPAVIGDLNYTPGSFDTVEKLEEHLLTCFTVQDVDGNPVTSGITVKVNGTTATVTVSAGQTWLANTRTFENVTWTVNQYEITWVDGNGDVLYSEMVDYGDTPAYDEETYGVPAKDQTVSTTYTFAGWNEEIVAVNGNATYTAKFTEAARIYKISWDTDGDGDVDKTTNVEYGTKPAAPAHGEKDNHWFKGWDPEITEVTGETTYTALFTPDTIYHIKFMVDGELFGEQYINVTDNEDAVVVDPGNPDANNEYANKIFDGWDVDIINKTPSGEVYEIVVNVKWNTDDKNNNNVDDDDETVTVTVNIDGEGTVSLAGATDKVLVTDNGDGTWTVIYDSSENGSSTVNVTAAPIDTGKDSEKNYVASDVPATLDVTVTKELDVQFALHSIDDQGDKEIEANGFSADTKIESVTKEAVLEAVLGHKPSAQELSMYTVKMYVNIADVPLVGSINDHIDIWNLDQYSLGNATIEAFIKSAIAEIIDVPGTENFEITMSAHGVYPEVTEAFDVTLNEGRDPTTVTHNGDTYTSGTVNSILLEEIIAVLTANTKITNYKWHDSNPEGTVLTAGETHSVKVVVTVDETTEYYGKEHTITVSVFAPYTQASVTIDAAANMIYNTGMTVDDKTAMVLDVVNPVITPDLPEGVTPTVWYLASEERLVDYTINIAQLDLGLAGQFLPDTMTVQIPVEEMWKNIGDDLTIPEAPSNDRIKEILLNDLIPNHATDYAAGNLTNDDLKQIFAETLAKYPDIAEYYQYLGAHQFGENEKVDEDGNVLETVYVTVPDYGYGAARSENCVLTLADLRYETTIKLNDTVSVTYNGYTEEELLALLVDGVYDADGNKIEGVTVEFVTDVIGLPASDASEITVKFNGNEGYKPSTATTTIVINKATVDVEVDDRLIKWYEGISYELPVVTRPEGVDTINFIVGLDVSDVNIDGGIKGIMGNVQLLLPEELQSLLVSADALLQGAGLDISFADGASMSISDLQAAVEALDDIFAGTDYEEYFRVLLNMLQSLPTDVADVQIIIGGELPTNIGVYLIGAVSADANYTTDMAVGVVVITPDGIKAELAWNQEDDNSIITRSLLTNKGEDGKYLFDTAAHAYAVGEGGTTDEATAQIAELFLGIDLDGNITIETDQTLLNVGAYVEVAMIANWGNQMYYSEPIVRPIVVVAETLEVDFVDDTGAVNNERHFEFFNVPQDGMEGNLLVTYKQDGEGYAAGDVVTDYSVKYYYVGVQTNGMLYASTTAPTHAGAYTITAIVTLRDEDGFITHAGQGMGALVIEPSESKTTVDNAAYPYGDEHKVGDLIHVTSVNVPELTVDKTVISAGLSTNLDEITGLDAINGTVNVDLPAWMDEVLNKLNILEAGYADGISAETFLSYADKIREALVELGVETESIEEVIGIVEQLPITTNLTFQDNIGYTEVGAYLIIAVATDPNHYPSVDAGIMVIYPDATKVELQFVEDWNGNYIFTWTALQNMNLEAKAYLDGAYCEPADQKVVNLYFGFTDNGEFLLEAVAYGETIEDVPEFDNGLYTQLALVNDFGNVMYYAEPISRVFMIVPTPATIEFIDENGAVNNDRIFTYNNAPHAMDARVTVNGVVVTDLSGLTVRYSGVQSNGKLYNSTEAPVDAGTYVVTATYTARDDQGRLVTMGTAVGAMVIKPAVAEIGVDNVAHEYGTAYDTESMITVSSDVDVTIDKTVITVMLNTDGTFSETGLNAIQGAVNMDLPTWLDEILAGYSIFDNGLTVTEFASAVASVEAELKELGIDTEILDRLVDVANQFPADAEITFHDQSEIAPTAVGAYLVIGVVTDPNFYPAMDAGLLVIYPAVEEVKLSWIYEDVNNNNIYTEDTLDVVDMGAKADIEEDISELIKTLFIGVDVQNWKIALVDSQDELNLGVYEEFAFVKPNVNSVIYYAEPINRPVIVVANVYNVSIHDMIVTHQFDNTEKGMGDITVTTMSGENVDTSKGTLTVTYVGIDTQLRPYYSTEKPVHAGTYTVIATYVGTDADGDQAVGVGIGKLIIVPADVEINVDSHAVLFGQDYDFQIETTHNAINDEPKTLVIMAGVDLSAYTTEGKLGIDGTVNVDFPEPMDNVLEELFPELYVNGIGTNAFFAKYDEMVAAIEARGYDADLLKQLKEMLSKLNAVNLTFDETVKPTETGLYAVVAMVFDPDYKSAVDTALIAIAPNATVAELDFNAQIPSLLGMDLLPYDMADDFDFGAHVGALKTTDGTLSADDIVINDVIFGLTTDLELFIGSSEEAPSQMGIYDQIAYVPAAENALMAVLPIHRDFLITDNTANVVYIDPNGNPNWLREFNYDGTAKDMGATLMQSNGTVLTETPAVWYLGIENGVVFYSSSEAPTDAGLYTVIGYCFDSAENIYTVGLGAMKINPAEVTIVVDDKTMTVGDELPELTCTVDGLAEGDSLVVNVTTEADGTVAGEFEITATYETNPNYIVTEVINGTLTVEEAREVKWAASAQFGNTLALAIGFHISDIGEAEGCYAVLTRTYSDGRPDDVVTVTREDWIAQTVGGKAYYFVIYNGIAAKEMIDGITVVVYDADGNPVAEPYTESVRSYAMRALSKHSEKNTSSTLYVDLLNYGAAAQDYFNYAEDNLANAELTPEQKAFATAENIDCENKQVVDNYYVGSALQMKSAIRFAFVFRNVEDATHAVVRFTNHQGVEVNVTVDAADFIQNGTAVVVEDIRPADCYDLITVTVYNGEEVLTEAIDSLESYVARAENIHEVYHAFMKYANAALEYYEANN